MATRMKTTPRDRGPAPGRDPVAWFRDRLADGWHGTPQHCVHSLLKWWRVFATYEQRVAARDACALRLQSFHNTVHSYDDAQDWIDDAFMGVHREPMRKVG
jgi:hypothetical protein